MGKTKNVILSNEQRSELEKSYRFGSCHRFRMRCRAVILKADCTKTEDISEIVGYGKLAIYNWLKRWESNGLDGLREKGGRGVKPLMSSADTESVKKAVKEYRSSIKRAKASWEKNSRRDVSDSMFFSSHKGAGRAAVYFSIAMSCRLNGVNMFDYVTDMLNRCASWPPTTPVEKYRDLLR